MCEPRRIVPEPHTDASQHIECGSERAADTCAPRALSQFYKSTKPEWICLGMTRASLAASGITLKFENPSPVGTTPALNAEQSGGERFPHIYGGIPPTGVVFEERPVRRAADGTFLAIDGLVDAPSSTGTASTSGAAGLAIKAAVGLAITAAAARFVLTSRK